jgi:hypothetical protein
MRVDATGPGRFTPVWVMDAGRKPRASSDASRLTATSGMKNQPASSVWCPRSNHREFTIDDPAEHFNIAGGAIGHQVVAGITWNLDRLGRQN